MDNRWQAGAAKVSITPPLGLELTGYGNRPGPAAAWLDPLHARAVVLAAGGRRAALVGLDLLGLDADLVGRIRALVAEGCGIGAESLLLNCSHTHAGPATQSLRGLGRRDEAYCDLVVRWTASVVVQAASGLQPASLSSGRAPCAIGRNRRERGPDGATVLGENPAGAYDPTAYALRVDDERGQPIAIWFSHATHPVVLGSENTAVSADFPGAAAADLETLFPGTVAIFGQGCAGDVNPVRRGTPRDVTSTGRALAGAALAAVEAARPLVPRLAAALGTVALPLQPPPSAAAARGELEQARAALATAEAAVARGEIPAYRLGVPRSMVAWAADYLAAARQGAPAAAPLALQAVRLGDAAILATSAETFAATGQAIQAAAPFAETIALGYTNGCIGYLPTADAFLEGGYEVAAAFKYYGTQMLTPAGESLVLDAAQELLRRIAD